MPCAAANILTQDEEQFAQTVRSIEAHPLFRALAARGLVRRSRLSGWIPAERYWEFLDTEMLPILAAHGLTDTDDWLARFGTAGEWELHSLCRDYRIPMETAERIRRYARHLLTSDSPGTSSGDAVSELAGQSAPGGAAETAQTFLEGFVARYGLSLDQFRTHILSADEPVEKAAARLCVPADDLRRARDAATSILVLDAMDQRQAEPSPAARATPRAEHQVVATVTVSPSGLPHLTMSPDCEYAYVYRLTSHAVAAVRAEAASDEEADEFLRALRLANQRKTTLYRVLVQILRAQSAYFTSGRDGDLAPLSQAEVARRLGEHRSVVCRAVRGRRLAVGSREVHLDFLLQPRGEVIRRLAKEYPGLPDSALADILERRFGLRLSRRTIAYHRQRDAKGRVSRG